MDFLQPDLLPAQAPLAACVGYVFQNPDDQLFEASVRQEVIFGPRNLGWAEQRVVAGAQAALAMVDLENMAGRHPYDLSPGERRRVALASVLAMDTPVVVLDEPTTTGQDYAGVNLVGRIVDGLKRRGKTLIVVTHDIDFCAEHFDRVVVMAQGRVLLDGPSRAVLARTGVLAQTYVEPPQMIRLAQGLEIESMPMNKVVLMIAHTTDGFQHHLWAGWRLFSQENLRAEPFS